LDLLDIVLHYDCNLKCTYCTCAGEMRHRKGLTAAEILPHVDRAAAAGCIALSITGGEPTIRHDLLPLIRYARHRGFSDIKIQTNGLVFSTANNVERALEAGVTRIGLSVHGHNSRDADAYARITQSGPESHTLFLAAVDHLVAADVTLSADLIVMTETVDTLLDGLADLHKRGIQAFNLWYVSLTDDNRNNVDSMPRISDALATIVACMDYGRAQGVVVNSLHLPRCVLPGYETHVTHPGVGRNVLVVTPESTFQLSDSRLSGGCKPDRCNDCTYNPVCPGLREDYVARFGDDELQPVTG
jgi:molybdenum cofactor biosynthesis enzyme MoaA